MTTWLLQEELGLLRMVWDMAGKVLSTFSKYYSTPWTSVSVDAVLEQSRAMSKDVESLSKAMRLYDVYQSAPFLHLCLSVRFSIPCLKQASGTVFTFRCAI